MGRPQARPLLSSRGTADRGCPSHHCGEAVERSCMSRAAEAGRSNERASSREQTDGPRKSSEDPKALHCRFVATQCQIRVSCTIGHAVMEQCSTADISRHWASQRSRGDRGSSAGISGHWDLGSAGRGSASADVVLDRRVTRQDRFATGPAAVDVDPQEPAVPPRRLAQQPPCTGASWQRQDCAAQ